MQVRDDLDDDLLHRRETRIVVQVNPAHGDRRQQKVFPVGHEGRQRVDTKRLFRSQGCFPGGQIRPLGRTQEQFRERTGFRKDKRILKVNETFFPVQLGDFAHNLPVAVNIGGIEMDPVVSFAPADIQIRRGTRGGKGRDRNVVLVLDQRTTNPSGDNFAVILHGYVTGQTNRARYRPKEA